MRPKYSIIKYIFIIFAIFIVIFTFYKIKYKEKTNIEKNVEESKLNNIPIITNLRLGIANFDTINPIITENKDMINLSTIIYEPLIAFTNDYNTQNVLAEECSKINDTTYIVKLKDNLKWENGSKLTATDVQFTIEKLKEGKSTYSENVKNIENTEIVDNLTIRFNLKQKEPFFEYNLIFPIISSNQFSKEKNFYASQITPMSTGMYKIKSITSESIELIKNNNWYKAEKIDRKIETIKINLYNTMGDAYNSFKIGNIDMICTSNVNINDYIGTLGFTEKDYNGRELDFLSLNCSDNILSRKEVRQAINYSIDKKKINTSVFKNKYYVSSFPLDYGCYLYTNENTNNFNPSKAKKVLEDSGWEYKYGRWQKYEDYATITINLNLIVDSSNKIRVEVANLIEKQLEDIGINVSVYQVSNSSYKNYLENKNYDMIITGIYNGYSPDLSYFLGEDNISNYNNKEVLQLLGDVENIVDEKILKEKYNKIQHIYEEDVPQICLYRNINKVIYSMKMIGNFEPNSYTAYYNFNSWYRQ